MWEHCMKRWAFISGLSGTLWMVFLLYSNSFRLATMSNYPGSLCSKVGPSQRHRDVAGTVLAFNIWFVLTSGLEWIFFALAVRLALRLGASSDK
jgi:hypothetical protein